MLYPTTIPASEIIANITRLQMSIDEFDADLARFRELLDAADFDSIVEHRQSILDSIYALKAGTAGYYNGEISYADFTHTWYGLLGDYVYFIDFARDVVTCTLDNSIENARMDFKQKACDLTQKMSRGLMTPDEYAQLIFREANAFNTRVEYLKENLTLNI